jgi:hypothetical protein
MTTTPSHYYQRFDPSKEYEEHRFIAGRALQSPELNEIQKAAAYRIKGIADVLLKDGAVVRDAGVMVDKDTGQVQCASGAVYINGAVRGVAPAVFTIPTTGSISIGVRLIESIVTAAEDPALRDPATNTRAYDDVGADRLKVHSEWGWDGDGADGEFFPVYGVVDGVVSAKEPPPNLDAVTQALARYDRDSAGGSYVVSGLNVTQLDDVDGSQFYSIAAGRARVFGYGVEYAAARRVEFQTAPDLLPIIDEPFLSATSGAQRVNLARTPATAITRVAITAQKTVTLVHGVVTGASDPLPDTSVVKIVSVSQGATNYAAPADYKLTAGQVDWSPPGAEPAPGSTYSVTYQYITTVAPTAVDDNGFTVTGAVAGTLVLTDYSQKLPRIDRLCLDVDGFPVWVKGVPSSFSPQSPSIPGDVLPLASVYQTWTSTRQVLNDGVRMVPMPYLSSIDNKLDYLLQEVARTRLESDIHTREGGTKKGLFVDPFLDDSQRDAGTPQTAAIVNGELILPITASISQMPSDVSAPTSLAYNVVPVLAQPFKTTSMAINPYMAFAPVPAKVTLTPAVDRWTVVDSSTTSQVTQRFMPWSSAVLPAGFDPFNVSSSTTTRTLVSSFTTAIEKLRPISVSFQVSGFGPNEVLSAMTFDGIAVTPVAP